MCIGGEDLKNRNRCKSATIYTVDTLAIKKVNTTSRMIMQREGCKSFVIGSNVYCFSGDHWFDEHSYNFYEVYYSKTDKWKHLGSMPDCISIFCACLFMGKIYFFYKHEEGCFNRFTSCTAYDNRFSSCTVYDPERNDWVELAKMQTPRNHASCTVFQGQCVVAGGLTEGRVLKSVETYDHHLDKWSFLPSDMQIGRAFFSLLTVGNKMFVIGETTTSVKENMKFMIS